MVDGNKLYVFNLDVNVVYCGYAGYDVFRTKETNEE